MQLRAIPFSSVQAPVKPTHVSSLRSKHTSYDFITKRVHVALYASSSSSSQSTKAAPEASSRPKNVYELLGVSKTASRAEIKKAFRLKAATCHPDVDSSKAAAEKFQALQLAYKLLTNTDVRALHDTRGLQALSREFTPLKLYVGESTADSARRGGDVYSVVGLPFSEAVTGVEKDIIISALSTCSVCHGNGSGATPIPCHVCGGSGDILLSKVDDYGVRVMSVGICPACMGRGLSPQKKCTKCRGAGRMRVKRAVQTKIPAGMTNDTMLRIRGKGDAGIHGGESGDLILKFELYEDMVFVRDGDDVLSEVNISIFDAIMGVNVNVNTARGLRDVNIPPGTQHGHVLVLQGAGVVKNVMGGVERGDHRLTVYVDVPHGGQLGEKERELVYELGVLSGTSSEEEEEEEDVSALSGHWGSDGEGGYRGGGKEGEQSDGKRFFDTFDVTPS